METPEFQIVLTTCPDAEVAETIASSLVAEGLAACVNILAPVRSIYTWKGQVETAEEYLLLVKSQRAQYEAIEQRILRLHPYELPEIVAVPITSGLAGYLAWLAKPGVMT
jgi:periplasmic divalent cation tolerance protein